MKKTLILGIVAMAASLAIAAPKGDNKTAVSQNLNIFNSIYKELQVSYVDTIDSNRAIREAIDAMLWDIDPYTQYYSQDEQEDLTSLSSGEFGGIGCVISARDGHIMMRQPQWGSPSRKAGVKHGDILIAIDGDTLPYGYTTTSATKRLRGKPGTPLRLTVKRPYATDSIFDIDITRGTITNEAVPYYGIMPDSVGYIKLTTFSNKSAADVKHAILELKKHPGLKGLMLDLRDNGGGLLESAVQIVGYFVPKGTEVVTVKYRDPDNEKTYKTSHAPIAADLPMAVLINDNTASASEIVSGALQDLDRAVIVGSRSFGKGLVQSSRQLPYDGMLKLTVGRYYIPSGRLIQAIDYSHRNPDGTVARIPDSLTNVYSTAHGRQVRDGGGITPDVTVKKPDANRLLYNVVVDDWAYNYATRFAALQGDNMPADETEFVITDSIFADFKSFIDPDKFKYDRACDLSIKTLREAAELEGYMNDEVSAELDKIEGMLRHDLNHDLDINRDMLVRYLDDEIASRYYDDAVGVRRTLADDLDVQQASAIILDPSRYKELLSPAKEH